MTERKFLLFLMLLCGIAGFCDGALAGRGGHDKAAKSGASAAAEGNFDARLMGLKGDQLKALLGAPVLIRRENGAEVWQYIKANCALDIFLLEKKPGEGIKVQYVDAFNTALPKQGEPVVALDRKWCLQLFASQAEGSPALPAGGAPLK